MYFFRGERGQAISAERRGDRAQPPDVDVIADVGGRLIAFGDIDRGEALLASATAQRLARRPGSIITG